MRTIKERLTSLASYHGLSMRAFEDKCGLNRGNISNMGDGSSIGSDKLSKIFDTYPDVNPLWLISGKGEMLKTNCTSQQYSVQEVPVVKHKYTDNSTNNQDSDSKNRQTRPRIPFDAAAGSLSIALGSVSENECELLPVIPTFPRYDFTIVARGESMEPQYMSGDELACLFIKDSSFIQWGRTHVLDTAQGVVVKRIFDNGISITCKSNNQAYPDFDIPKEDVYHIALVVGLLRHF